MTDRHTNWAIVIAFVLIGYGAWFFSATKLSLKNIPINEIQVYAQKRPVVTWQLHLCRNLVKHPDGSVKTGQLKKYLDCTDMIRTDI